MTFFAGLYGEIHKNEARRWFNSLRRHIRENEQPVYAIVDLYHVSFIGTTARLQFADATRLPEVKSLLFVASEPHMLQAIRMIGMLGERGTTHAFNSLDDARQFVDTQMSAETTTV